jgi:hypothetical protein
LRVTFSVGSINCLLSSFKYLSVRSSAKFKTENFLKWLVARHLIVLPDQKEVLKCFGSQTMRQAIVDPKYWETIELAA